jgi:transcriptional regulator with XRE-family HTH domain
MKLEKLKEIRKSKGISRQTLANISGVSRDTIDALENGKTNVKEAKLNTLLSLATALRVKVSKLLPDEWGKLL